MALALAAKAEGEGVSEILRCSRQPEVGALADALGRLGLAVEWPEYGAKLTGGELQAPDGAIDTGRSEALFACLAGLLAGAPFRSQLEGNAASRPGPVLEALGALDTRVSTPVEGVFPLQLGGGALKAGHYRIGTPSTAVKCAMFLAGLGIEGEVELLQETAREEGFRSMLERGRSKVAAGLTTPEELVRVLAP